MLVNMLLLFLLLLLLLRLSPSSPPLLVSYLCSLPIPSETILPFWSLSVFLSSFGFVFLMLVLFVFGFTCCCFENKVCVFGCC